jgi:hypothetical protein
MQFASDTTITVANGSSTLTLSNLQSTTHALSKAGAGVLSVNAVRAASLNVTQGTVSVIPSGGNAAAGQVGNLTVGAGATLDLNNNDLDVKSGNTSGIQALVKNAYHSGAWDQPGITSSAAKSSGGHPTALAVVSGADYISATGSGAFHGLTVSPGDTVVKYTFAGDANLDGTVSTADFTRLAASFGNASAGWIQGDFNYDGKVNALDFNAVATNFGQSLPPSAIGSLVPEPTCLSAAAIFCVALLGRRRARDRAETL